MVPRAHNQNSISIVSAVFAQLTAVSSGIPGHVLSPKNCLFAWGSGPSFNTIPSVHPSLTQMASRSVQPFLHSAQQTVSILHNGRPFPPTFPLPMGILQSIRHSISIGLAVCAQLKANSPYTLQLAPLSPKIASSHRGSGPPSNTWFLGPTRVLHPNSISIGSAIFAGLTSVTDRETDHATCSVTISRIYVHSTAMWPNNCSVC